MRETFSMEDFGGEVASSFEDLLAPSTQEERVQDAHDLADIEQAERDAATERPFFV